MILFVFLVIMMFAACSTPPSSGPQAMQGAMEVQPIADYRLRPGDTLEVKFFYHAQLDDRVVIGPDGKISLQLIDEVLAAGLTASQLDDVLTKEYANYLENYSITVMVREYSGLKAFVGGEVVRPGFVSLGGNKTVLQSIFEAQGFKATAKTESVILLRKGPQNNPTAMVIDLASVMDGERLENDVYLMPADIVYVPRTSIAKAGIFVDQYIRKVMMADDIMRGAGQALGWFFVRENVYGYDSSSD